MREIAKGNGVKVVEDSYGSPLIYQEGPSETKVMYFFKEDDTYKVVVRFVEDLSIRVKNKIDLLDENNRYLISNLRTNYMYADPACYSGKTIVKFIKITKDTLGGISRTQIFSINELLSLVSKNLITDPFAKISILRLAQELRDTEYKLGQNKNHKKIAVEEAEGSKYVPEMIDDIDIEQINLNIKSIDGSEKDYGYLGNFANLYNASKNGTNVILREKEDVVAILAFNEKGEVALVKQERGGLGERSYELPAGRIATEEKVADAVKKEIAEIRSNMGKENFSKEDAELAVNERLARAVAEKELNEETGMEGQVTEICRYNTPNTIKKDRSGPSTTRIYVGYATVKAKEKLEQDAGENVEPIFVSLHDLVYMINEGKIKDTNSVQAVYSLIEILEKESSLIKGCPITKSMTSSLDLIIKKEKLAFENLSDSMKYIKLAEHMKKVNCPEKITQIASAMGAKLLLGNSKRKAWEDRQR